MKLFNKIISFMYDKYGIDELGRFIIWVYLLISLINILVRWYLLDIISIILFVIFIYRFTSKNKGNRYRENKIFIKYKNKLLNPIIKRYNYIKRKYNDKDLYVYKRCKKCKRILRLPIPDKRGFKYIKCPSCLGRYKYFIFNKQKIEIIRKRDR